MPKPKPIIFLRDKIAEMLQQTHYVSRPAFAAAVLLLIASALTLSVVIGLRDGQDLIAEPVNPPIKPPEAKAMMEVQNQVPTPPQPAIQQSAPQSISPTLKTQQSATQSTENAKPEPVILGQPHRPLKGEIAIQYGWQMHPVFKDWRFHNGIDIMGREGEPVSAVWSGEVKEIFQDKTAGLTIAVKSGEYTVYYGSLATVEVRKGNIIKAGRAVGTVGTSPAEPYSHLHLAIKQGEKYIDPAEKNIK